MDALPPSPNRIAQVSTAVTPPAPFWKRAGFWRVVLWAAVPAFPILCPLLPAAVQAPCHLVQVIADRINGVTPAPASSSSSFDPDSDPIPYPEDDK